MRVIDREKLMDAFRGQCESEDVKTAWSQQVPEAALDISSLTFDGCHQPLLIPVPNQVCIIAITASLSTATFKLSAYS